MEKPEELESVEQLGEALRCEEELRELLEALDSVTPTLEELEEALRHEE